MLKKKTYIREDRKFKMMALQKEIPCQYDQ